MTVSNTLTMAPYLSTAYLSQHTQQYHIETGDESLTMQFYPIVQASFGITCIDYG